MAHYAGSTDATRLADRQPALGLPRARPARASPTPRTCCARSTATTSRPASRSRGFAELKADGSTACGCWIYSRRLSPTASTRRAGATPATSTTPRAAGSRPSGAGRGRPTGACSTTARPPTPRASRGRSARSTSGGTRSRASGRATTSRTSRSTSARTTARRDDARGHGRDLRRRPVHHDGRRPRAGCTRRAGLLDGPLPTHYEPLESPVAEPALPRRSAPTRSAIRWERPDNPHQRRPATRATRASRRRSG